MVGVTDKESTREIFAQRFKNARLKAGLSMEDLAKEINYAVSKHAIQKYEAGKMMPEAALLPVFAAKLNVRVDEFFRPLRVKIKLKFNEQGELVQEN